MADDGRPIAEAVRAFEDVHDAHNVRVTLAPGDEWLTFTCHDCDEAMRIAVHGLQTQG